MPMYEYRCNGCKNLFEELISNEEDERNLVCPACKNSNVEKAFSAFAVGSSGSNMGAAPSCPSTGAPCHKGGGFG